ncbi:FliM/FliN family flagellar motor switch protein [Novosphingobium sp. CF614]|uniref:FliM/FliN family flagellar motor switch protein n=1 Tax=Novosphingobium sp. CF614 TaxID=1884364 RepID=UPI00116067A9|nr:FliM/FliN family flagellar motor C-terminal domain-containing protein [Novosphingobium sp. CF614]
MQREWLPDGALTPVRVSSACAAVLDAWRKRWFVAEAGRLTLNESPGDRPGRSSWIAAYDTAGLSLSLNDEARKALHQALLGALPDGADISQADRLAIQGLERAVIDDLGVQLSRLADVRTVGSASHLNFNIQVSGTSLLRLSARMDWLVRLVRLDLTVATTAHPRQAMVSLKTALESCRVSIEAELGSAQIEMKELADLVAGDVVVLDRGVGMPLDLLHVDSGMRVAHGVLTDAGGHNAVRVTN